MSKEIRCMLATNYTGEENLSKYVASFKLDGIRCLVNEHEAITRTGKPIRNKALHDFLVSKAKLIKKTFPEIEYLDGELVVNQHNSDTWGRTSSIVMSYDKPIDGIEYHVFDYIPEWNQERILFVDRLKVLRELLKLSDTLYILLQIIKVVERYEPRTHEDLQQLMDYAIGRGYEGIMLNKLYSFYKRGRSTPNSAELVKCKRWDYDEAVVVDVEELMINDGIPERGRDGIVRRSKIKDNLVGAGVLGALVLDNGLRVGTGFTDKQRRELWYNDKGYCPVHNMVCRYKYLPSVGKRPRHPVFIALGQWENGENSRFRSLQELKKMGDKEFMATIFGENQ